MLRLVLGIAIAVCTLMPNVSMADDQQIADYVKSRLLQEQQRGNLRGFNVDMRVDRGTVWFKGYVSNELQEMTILQAAQRAGHLGVVQIVDDIEVRKSNNQMTQSRVAPTQYQQSVYEQRNTAQQAYQAPTPARQAAYQPQPRAMNAPRQVAYQETSIPNAINTTVDTRAAVSNGVPMPFAQSGMVQRGSQGVPAMQSSAPMVGSVNAAPAEPYMAGGMAGQMGAYESPSLPGYAWPGYAAYPNYGAVSYPKQHSASAWPYIGPFYPYPQVPLGWRKVIPRMG